ncbi:MAG: hypothetical protein KAJ73_03100, partial [Zetaproteobacteria bacterium]|nr:hypothetical protein [Zetaproteobacteria bacterium]
FLLLFAGLSLSGCKVAHMALPKTLQSGSSELAVEGRALSIFSKSFQFGHYNVTDVHRGWTKGKGFSISDDSASKFSASEAEQQYEFSVSEPDSAAWDVQCATVADWKELETKGLLGGGFGIEFSSNRQLVCILKQEGAKKASELVMAQSLEDDVFRGVLIDGAARIDIAATHKLDTTPLKMKDPTGYVFNMEGRPVGAVEVINKGTVWLNNSVTPETRSALAATSAVLLLYQDIKKMSQDTDRM